MALVSTTTVASSSYLYDPLFPTARSWCRPRSRGGGAGPRLAVLARAGAARARIGGPAREEAAVAAERGRYSYEVDSLIDRLSNLAPRGSIARCLDTVRHRLTLQDFAAVYREFSRRGDWQRSLRLFKYMQRQSWCRPDEHIHAIVIGMLGRQGPALLEKCLEVFHDLPAAAAMRSLANQSEMLLRTMLEAGVSPDAASYRHIVDAFAGAGNLSRVAELFAEMADAGHTPDASAYPGLMEAHTRIGAMAEAVAVLRQMQADGCAPMAATYRVLLNLRV